MVMSMNIMISMIIMISVIIMTIMIIMIMMVIMMMMKMMMMIVITNPQPHQVTAPPITPQDSAGLEAVGSLFVCTVTEAVAALAMPKVKPISVMVAACPLVNDKQQLLVKTMEEAPGVPTPMFTPGVDTYVIGVETLVKNPDG
jgi:hypothetical protein